jgi:hypothetical protein
MSRWVSALDVPIIPQDHAHLPPDHFGVVFAISPCDVCGQRLHVLQVSVLEVVLSNA